MAEPSQTTRAALTVGLVDALGFVGGALAGWQLGRLLGFDVTASGDWTASTLLAWVFLLAGLALGKWGSQQWHKRQSAARK